MRTTEERWRFKAKCEDGTPITLVVMQDFHTVGDMRGCGRKIAGMKSLFTADGDAVNHIAQGKYEIVQTGEQLISNDPNAPKFE